jgi:putative membrane protein
MNNLTSGVKELKDGVATVDKGLKQVQSGVQAINEGASQLNEQKENADTCIQALQMMQTQYEALAAAETDVATKAQYQQLAQAAAGSIQYMQGAEQLAASVAASTNGTADGSLDGDGAQDLAAALTQIEAATNTKSTSQNLYTGLTQLSKSASAMSKNAKTIRSYKAPLMKASKTVKESISTITSKLKLIYKNGNLITDNNKKLESAADSISSNATLIQKNSKKLTASSSTFRSATKSMEDGTGKLVSGVKTLVSSTGQVSDGIGKLADGAVDLYDGMKTFQKDGADKLADTVNQVLDSSSDLENRVKAVGKASKSYKSFSGVSDEMDGSVKFIMTTKEIKAEE